MEIEMLDNYNISRAWQELVSKFESRTISSAEFCKLHNISRGSIYKWRKYFLDDQNDFDGSGDPLEKDKDYTHDYCTILNSFKFYGVDLPIEMKKFIGIHSLIDIVSTLYMKKDFKKSLEYLESLKIKF